MRMSLRMSSAMVGLAMVLAGGAVNAQTAGKQPGNNTIIGAGMICDSQEQAARFLELRASGRKADAAMAAVNKESHNKQACGLATIAFVQDGLVASKSIDNKLIQVVRINILAGFTGNGWQPVTNFVQYAVVEAEGIEI